MSAARNDAICAAQRAYRRRRGAIALVLIGLAILIVGLGTAGVEAINVLRAYSVAGSHWSKAETSALVDLIRYIDTHESARYRKFQSEIAIINSDHEAREAVLGEHFEYRRAVQAFEAGGNEAGDTPGLAIALYLFHDWPPYAAALRDWKRGENWVDELARLGHQIHGRIQQGASESELGNQLDRVDALGTKLADNEHNFLIHVSRASATARNLTLLFFGSLSALAVLVCLLTAWRILRASMESEIRSISSEQQIRDYAELATDWFCEVDADFHFTYVSAPNCDEKSNSLKSLQGRNLLKVPELRRIEGTQIGAAPVEPQAFRRLRFELMGENGRATYWSVSGNPQFAPDGAFAGYRAVATDISEYIATQDALTQARDEAVRANRAKSAFLANMSHELRTPLNAILGFSQMMERQQLGPLGNDKYVGYARDVRESGEHLLAIINDLLDHSRIEAGQMKISRECLDVRDVVEETLSLCGPQADALHVALAAELAAGEPRVVADRLRLKQALINIVTNAIKFSPGGSVTLTTKCQPPDLLHFVIADTGIGMDAAGIAQALRPFGQVDSGLNRKYEGTGLGVPLSKALIELQGGTFAIESEPDKGTRVTLTLPLARFEVSTREPALAAT